MNRLCVLFLAFALALASHAIAQAPGVPGKFDFYVLALSWSPSYCEAAGERADNDQCRRGRPFSFVVHGLWPQYERGYPRSCVNPAPWLSEALIRSMLELMPARGLVINEWRRHGTCAGLPPERYFETLRHARERVVIPERFRRLDGFVKLPTAEIEEEFIAANQELKADMIAITCDNGRLREVRVCLSKELTFRSCPEVDRRACQRRRVVMPPTRGG